MTDRPSPAPLPSLFGLSVLIVDDNPVVLQATRAGAFHLGLAVECAEYGEAALAALRAHPVDAVLMDLHMPGLDGIATTRAIRALGTRWADLPVIAISAGADTTDAARCRAAGLNSLLDKPVALRLLADTLTSLCGPQGAGRQGARRWYEAAVPATAIDPSARAVPLAGPGPTSPQSHAPARLPLLDAALDEQLALHGASHPLTRALMRAAGREAAGRDRPVSLSGR
jgi:two-component system sensor histidine kinase/response regulator